MKKLPLYDTFLEFPIMYDYLEKVYNWNDPRKVDKK